MESLWGSSSGTAVRNHLRMHALCYTADAFLEMLCFASFPEILLHLIAIHIEDFSEP
jgi:hypothetical protein